MQIQCQISGLKTRSMLVDRWQHSLRLCRRDLVTWLLHLIMLAWQCGLRCQQYWLVFVKWWSLVTRLRHLLFSLLAVVLLVEVTLFLFHLDEHLVHLFHLCDTFFILLDVLSFLGFNINSFTTLRFLHKTGRVFPCLGDAINRRCIDIIRQRRRIKFPQPITQFLFLSKLYEVLKSAPLLVRLFNWALSTTTHRLQNRRLATRLLPHLRGTSWIRSTDLREIRWYGYRLDLRLVWIVGCVWWVETLAWDLALVAIVLGFNHLFDWLA